MLKLSPYFCLLVLTSACAGEALYPPRPPVAAGPPVADPPFSRVSAHVSLTREGLTAVLNDTIPKASEGTFQFLGERKYTWQRGPLALRFDNSQGKIGVRTEVEATAELPAKTVRFKMGLLVEVQPVISSTYKLRMQAPTVTITPESSLLKVAEWGGGLMTSLRTLLEDKLRDEAIDLVPMLGEAYARVAQPFVTKLGDADACVELGVKSLETGPTLLIDGLEKDVAMIVAPSLTLPCSAETQAASNAPSNAPVAAKPPPLTNVPSLPSGPFTVVVPVAATYTELQKAMSQAFTDGKLFFSKEFPDLYLADPEVYANGGEVVVKLRLDGFVKKGATIPLKGELYLSGHPTVHDNELEFDDMQPTIETSNALLKLKTALDAAGIKRQVRQALRLDISQRLLSIKQKLAGALTFGFNMTPEARGCFKADVGRIEVANIYAHDTYLRLYVQATAQAGVYVPCPFTLPPASQPATADIKTFR